jgi:hypothetical protein
MARSESSRRESEVASRSMLPKSHNRRQAYRVECNCTRMQCLIVDICTGTQCVLEKRLSSVYLAQACPFTNASMEARLSRAPGFLGGRIRHRLENMFASIWKVRDIGVVSRVLARRCAPLAPSLTTPAHLDMECREVSRKA